MARLALFKRVPDEIEVETAPAPTAKQTAAEAPSPKTPGIQVSPPSPTVVSDKPTEPPPPPSKRNGRRRLILTAVGLIAAAAGSYYGYDWWTTGRFMVSTDDAYVGADTSAIAPRISGYVTQVAVTTNSNVKAGDPLVILDDSDEKLAVATAENQIASQEAVIARIDRQIDAGHAAVTQAQAAIASAQADLELAEADLKRAQKLAASQFASRQSLEQAQATRDKAAAAIDSTKAGLASAQANVAVLEAQRTEAERLLDQYRTQLDQRRLDLDRTVVRAPFDGVIGNRAVDPGEYVQAGQRLLALVPLRQVYIDANFKETQLADIHVGAPVKISVDAYDAHPVTGTVESVAPASGAVFSLLPPDNATGNFTKIVQRLAVRIAVPSNVADEELLRPGMSVVVLVDSRDGVGRTVAQR